MNKMKKMALLLLIAAASNSAKAQNEVIRLQAGQAFTLHSKVVAVGTGLPPKYLWYRDGSPIAGATSPDYTIPAPQAVGSNVQFKRAAYTDGCAERIFTNTVTITWCNLLIDGVCWADANVAQPGTFAPRPDMYTEFYQWNQPNKAWHPTNPGGGANIPGWPTNISASAWVSTPCPEGWRLPTREEFQALDRTSGGTGNNDATGGTWVVTTAGKGNAVVGRYYGYNHATCALNGIMTGCIFLPAVGARVAINGELSSQGSNGLYWASAQNSSTEGQNLDFNSIVSYPVRVTNKAYAFAIRCVQ